MVFGVLAISTGDVEERELITRLAELRTTADRRADLEHAVEYRRESLRAKLIDTADDDGPDAKEVELSARMFGDFGILFEDPERALSAVAGFSESRPSERALRCALERVDCTRSVATSLEVKGELHLDRALALRVPVLQRLADAPVHLASCRRREPVVENFLIERMPEGVATANRPIRPIASLLAVEQLPPAHEILTGGLYVNQRHRGRGGDGPRVEADARHGCGVDDAPRTRVEPPHRSIDHSAQALRDGAAFLRASKMRLGARRQLVGERHHEEGASLTSLVKPSRQLTRRVGRRKASRHVIGGRSAVELPDGQVRWTRAHPEPG